MGPNKYRPLRDTHLYTHPVRFLAIQNHTLVPEHTLVPIRQIVFEEIEKAARDCNLT